MFPRLRAPIVLIHGLFGFDRWQVGPITWGDYFRGIPERLREAGNTVLTARLSPTGGVIDRAAQLKDFLDRHLPRGPMHLFGHSMGGLDARYLISRMGFAPRVLSLTTLGTPHRGSPFADWALTRLIRLVSPLLKQFGLPVQAFHDLTTGACARFNDQVPDAPGVRYHSVAGDWPWRWNHPSWQLSAPIISATEGPNDGMVSIRSATWGQSSEVWPGDHMSLVNWPEPFVSCQKEDCLPRYAALLGRLPDEGL